MDSINCMQVGWAACIGFCQGLFVAESFQFGLQLAFVSLVLRHSLLHLCRLGPLRYYQLPM